MTPHIDLQPPEHESSQIGRIGWHPESRTLVVEFKAKPGNPPTVYHYQSVPEIIYNDLHTADSPGSVLARTLKANPQQFPCHKVTETDCECFVPESEGV